ncbi:hypothetical protein GOV08_00380 [Candidatus Woesearchaeota archaeon]|nr:hypothetical protein [Candidatus Woesearchaeota archaeon]
MKKKRFCPGCGKAISETQEFCKGCRPKEEISFKDIYFQYCSNCGTYFHKNKWIKTKDLESAIINSVNDSVKQKVDKVTPNIPDVTIAPGVNVDFTATVLTDAVDYEIPGRVLVTLCPKCAKQSASYFEGILQIRNPKEDVIDYVKERIDSDDSIHISKTEVVKGGVDFYVSSNKFLRKLGKEIKKRFDGELKESPQLFSRNRQTSKDIYRLNVLFRCG